MDLILAHGLKIKANLHNPIFLTQGLYWKVALDPSTAMQTIPNLSS